MKSEWKIRTHLDEKYDVEIVCGFCGEFGAYMYRGDAVCSSCLTDYMDNKDKEALEALPLFEWANLNCNPS